MNVSGWDFQVLSPAFTVHRGLFRKKSRPAWREKQNIENRKRFPHFKKEIFAKYNKDYRKELEKERLEELKGFERQRVS